MAGCAELNSARLKSRYLATDGVAPTPRLRLQAAESRASGAPPRTRPLPKDGRHLLALEDVRDLLNY